MAVSASSFWNSAMSSLAPSSWALAILFGYVCSAGSLYPAVEVGDSIRCRLLDRFELLLLRFFQFTPSYARLKAHPRPVAIKELHQIKPGDPLHLRLIEPEVVTRNGPDLVRV